MMRNVVNANCEQLLVADCGNGLGLDKEFSTPKRRNPTELSTLKLELDKEFGTPTRPSPKLASIQKPPLSRNL